MLIRVVSYRRITCVLMLVLTLLLDPLLTPSVVSANSVYDSVYHPIDHLLIATDEPTQECEEVDLSTSWSSYILDETKWSTRGLTTTQLQALKTSFQAALDGGRWGVSAISTGYMGSPGGHGPHKAYRARVFWTEDTSLGLSWTTINVRATGVGVHTTDIMLENDYGNYSSCQIILNGYSTSGSVEISTLNGWTETPAETYNSYYISNLFAYTDYLNYPTNYAGEQVVTSANEWTDIDNDGLSSAKEITQGTSSNNSDTDGDGLNDYVESQWNPNRDVIFCGTECEYPDPLTKDVYVEIDWMTDPIAGESFKPSEAQLDDIVSAFGTQGIIVHLDTGRLGGGSELPTYTENLRMYKSVSAADFYDYKDGVGGFANNRRHIWHYMIAGNQYYEDQNSSGAAYVGDDDSFISIGRIKRHLNDFPHASSEDDAIAGTILHELGHNLCLSDVSEYDEQPASCIYEGIHSLDNPTYSNYQSVMNYTYQMGDLLDFSTGLNAPLEDHDDWSGVEEGMGNFVSSNAEGDLPSSNQPNSLLLRPYTRSLNASRHIVE